MRHLLFVLTLLVTFNMYSQDSTQVRGIFYKVSVATSLTINEDYELFNESDDNTFIQPSALYVNNTLGYQFDNKTSAGFNVEYNWHSKQGLHFLPIYVDLKHSFTDSDVNFFIRSGYGKLVSIGNSFEKGSMFKAGIGIQALDKNLKNSVLFGLDFNHKTFGFRNTEKLSSVTLFLEFMFL